MFWLQAIGPLTMAKPTKLLPGTAVKADLGSSARPSFTRSLQFPDALGIPPPAKGQSRPELVVSHGKRRDALLTMRQPLQRHPHVFGFGTRETAQRRSAVGLCQSAILRSAQHSFVRQKRSSDPGPMAGWEFPKEASKTFECHGTICVGQH
ncbi:hypothetical protein L596_024227 [Steinernema carpocapsae]|uniref:Uncharacterized protein n=1 Tax=Steinernema carpocapsae TaxID=34508 RepID=A0A4V5ZZP1_STECR|nr:hypothetical protein L596_024227 [Steinernema carpocapsae]